MIASIFCGLCYIVCLFGFFLFTWAVLKECDPCLLYLSIYFISVYLSVLSGFLPVTGSDIITLWAVYFNY
ncbi:MAG: hypothetical protein JL50_13660 [Peptococcaceae bacterium BICA1-7]|nr:MAG: hypothetical protein JL50_13660 [Peptococcaceae bacterium BICA1-7]